MKTRIADRGMLLAADDEGAALKALARLLEAREAGLPAVLEVQGESIEVPDVVVRLLEETAAVLARGRAVAIKSYATELLPGEAAEILGLLPPQTARLFDEGQIPFTRDEGGYPRIQLEDVLAYKRRLYTERREALNELARLSQEYGLYETEFDDDPWAAERPGAAEGASGPVAGRRSA